MKIAEHPKDVRFKSIATNESKGNSPCIKVSYSHLSGVYYEDSFDAVWSFLSDVEIPLNSKLKLEDLSE